MAKEFSLQEVALHTAKEDIYIIMDDRVYDVTKWVDEHP